jgi:hypothetical protein
MTTIVIKAAPRLDFKKVQPGDGTWRREFEAWVGARKPIKYSAEELPIIPSDWHENLVHQHYVQYVLRGNYNERYLVARPE